MANIKNTIKTKFINHAGAIIILVLSIIMTVLAAFYVKYYTEKDDTENLRLICQDLRTKIKERLVTQALVLQCGAAYIVASDTVSRSEWKKYNDLIKIDQNLPGVQGIGYSILINRKDINNHIEKIRKEGFIDYQITPKGDRDIYSSILYLEPFSGRNLRAFGYDMFFDSTRRQAMELARDSDIAVLSGKVTLIQETSSDVQAGSLMYTPVYKNGMTINTIEQRRKAIKGWVYSPYRMNDLMNKILGSWDLPNNKRIRLQIYDNENISTESLLYDSQDNNIFTNCNNPANSVMLPIDFNGKKWTLLFSQNSQIIVWYRNIIVIVLICGIIIGSLLFILTLALIKSRNKAQQIELLNKQFEKQNTDKDRFISILAHDLKSPIGLMVGYLDLLSNNIRKYDIEKVETQIDIIKQSAQKTYNLLENTLLWARAQSGKIPFSPEILNLENIFKEVLEEVSINAESKSIEIHVSPINNASVYADQYMIHAVLRNLIMNAIKFTHNNGKINISAKIEKNATIITITDTGVGIDQFSLSKLFDIKNMTATAGTANETGSGLGLLLCKEFIEKHEGKIWVESELGKGSAFHFSLPLK
jgi:signal transduction histidine kinase